MAKEKATFAAGCFWGVEDAFMELNGVMSTRTGYTGGKTKNPSYEDVCSHKTGHAEAVDVTYNPQKIKYEELLKVFWSIHDPTQLNRQGPDSGSQYRSAIFYHTEAQKKAAEKSKKEQQKKLGKKIVTEIVQASEFYPAEDYHQQYLRKNHLRTCHSILKQIIK
jgi:peptide-methionine (S)-S-oxide reductase